MTTGLILGAAVWPDGPSPTLLRRAKHGAALFHAGRVDHLVACGGMGKHPPTEAAMIQAILEQNGVPSDRITQEDKSTTTGENIAYAIDLIGRDPVMIITDFYHAPRARLICRRLGVPCKTSAPRATGTSKRALIKSVLREIPAYLAYFLRLKS